MGETQAEDPPGTRATDLRAVFLRHRDGDRDALAELIQAFRAPVYSYLLRIGVPHSAADDLFQEIFIKVHYAAERFDRTRPLEPWVFTIVANTARSWFRARNDAPDAPAAQLENGQLADDSQQLLEAQETAAWLELQLQKLPLAQREAVLLCCYRQMSPQDAADALEIPLNTLKTNLHRARHALAKAVARRTRALRSEVSR